MEFTKEDLRNAFNATIEEIESKNGRVLSMYDVRKLTEQGVPMLDICIKNIPIPCIKDGFEKWLNSM